MHCLQDAIVLRSGRLACTELVIFLSLRIQVGISTLSILVSLALSMVTDLDRLLDLASLVAWNIGPMLRYCRTMLRLIGTRSRGWITIAANLRRAHAVLRRYHCITISWCSHRSSYSLKLKTILINTIDLSRNYAIKLTLNQEF